MRASCASLAVGAVLSLSAGAKPEFVLPETLPAAPGVECNVYFDGALDTVNSFIGDAKFWYNMRRN